jgi:5-methyltetrahydropteroyltriglutamate--homocysteine methyltransferase
VATDIRAEHVGSLVRQPWLLEAKEKYKNGALSLEGLRAVEDHAASENIALLEAAGMPVITDGEVRRDAGIASGPETLKLTSIEVAYLADQVPGKFKIALLSAAMNGMLRPEIIEGTAQLSAGLVTLQVEEISGLIDLGARWIQLDSLSYNQVFDRKFRESTRGADDPAVILDESVAADAAIVAGVRAKDPAVTIGMHICRGGNRGAYMASGSYEPVAERLFTEVPVDRFLLEYDSERAGGFEPLRFVPTGTVVVLGLITSRSPVLESLDDIKRRVDEASRYVDGESLAISPQCGFASANSGNLLTQDEQKRKLQLVVTAADAIWG